MENCDQSESANWEDKPEPEQAPKLKTVDVIRKYSLVLFSYEKTHAPAWAEPEDDKPHQVRLPNGEYVTAKRTYWEVVVGLKPSAQRGLGECQKCEKAFRIGLMEKAPEFPSYPIHENHSNHPKNERVYKVTFSMGAGHIKRNGMPRPPSLSDILEDAFLNAQGFHWGAVRFEDWATEYGYNPDSRKAETIFKASLDNYIMFRDMVGMKDLADILETWEE
jgi:hypothetical protein